MSFTRKPIALIAVFAWASMSVVASAREIARDSRALEEVVVRGVLAEGVLLTERMLSPLPASTSDTASLLRNLPGISLQTAGGVSSLPVIRGMADDRVRTKVDGMDIVSACANHMNPPLSYIDPSNVDTVKVFAGITPVSLGGDSIAGTIIVNSAEPEFAKAGKALLIKGDVGGFYRSNGNAIGKNVSATLASEKISVVYSGSTARADNYRAADDFKPAGAAASGRGYLSGDEVGSSAYESTNQSLAIALQQDNHLIDLKLGVQHIPEQGFLNQRMDMSDNKSRFANLHYKGMFDWGAFESRLYKEKTRHSMNFGADKQFLYGDAPGMPMETEGSNTGAVLHTEVVVNQRDLLRTGFEFQTYELDDWWPPSGTGMMMAPNTFWNIRHGERDRYDVFGEWEAKWTSQWTTLLGVRSGTVRMDADDVQGYSNSNGMGKIQHNYLSESTAFNHRRHQRTDDNLDFTALARFTPDANQSYEAGFARKTRSPNLYERYSWSTSGMSMLMVNLAGDGNGYVGNLNLKPEVANTLSATVDWHDARRQSWSVQVTPYLTYVDDFIDARRCSSGTTACNAANQTATDAFVYLQFVNQAARLYGADVAAFYSLAENAFGTLTIKGLVGYVNGENRKTDDDLYNIMPFNARLSLEHRLGKWTNVFEAHLVDAKDNVSAVRNELETSGYSLFNVRTSYEWKRVRIDLGIENLSDKNYALPLGGAYVGQGSTMSGTGVPYGIAVPGMGRSVYSGFTYSF